MRCGIGKKSDFPDRSSVWFAVAATLFLMRICPWSLADFWFDEMLTFTRFIASPDASSVTYAFRYYPFANNHILFSAVVWLWAHALGLGVRNMFLLRLPSILFGLGTLAVVAFAWRPWLGRRLAGFSSFRLPVSGILAFYVPAVAALFAAVGYDGVYVLEYSFSTYQLYLGVD